MKTLQRSFVLLLSLFVVASCSKKEDAVNPDAGSEVAGTYQVAKIRLDNGTMLTVQPGYTKKIQLIRLSETTVDLSLEFNEPNKTPANVHVTDVISLKRSGQVITLHAPNGTQIGDYSAKTLQLQFTEAGQAGTFIGTR